MDKINLTTKYYEEYLYSDTKHLKSLASFEINSLYHMTNQDIVVILNNCCDIYYLYIGYYFLSKNQLETAKKYFLISIENDNLRCLHDTGKFFINQLNEEKIGLKYLERAFELGSLISGLEIADYHYSNYDYFIAVRYYKSVITSKKKLKNKYSNRSYYKSLNYKPDVSAMISLGEYYLDMGTDLKGLEYLVLAVENKSELACLIIGDYYYDKQAFPFAEKYYKLGTKLGCIESTRKLANYYENNVKDIKNMLKYYILAAKNGCEISEKKLEKYRKILSGL